MPGLSHTEREQTRGREQESVRLGIITGTTEDGLYLVRFDGADAASGKGYPALVTGYTLTTNDRVACMRVRGSYIILGKY